MTGTGTTGTLLLRLEGVRRVHGAGHTEVVALDHVDLTVAAGEMVAVTGRSGAGKSTLLNLAGGLDRPTEGRVVVGDDDLRELSASQLAALRRRSVGYVFQQSNLIPTLTAIENVTLPLELDGVARGAAATAAGEALEGMLDRAMWDRFPDELSGGERQRVAIARGLVGPRRLLLADEPTGALDEVTAEGVMRILRARCDAGAAALVVTHDAAQAAWADRVVRLRDGAIASEVSAEVTA